MIRDNEEILSEEQELAAGTSYSKVFKFGKGDAYVNPFACVSQGKTKFAVGAKLTASVETSEDEVFTTPKTLLSSGEVVATADGFADFILKARLAIGNLEYLRFKFVTDGAGTVNAYLAPTVDMATV
ncbi:hypothetical protein AAIR98_001436 [Elusimicrobium simillimum]|uniref:hypothetical protein n=1 Tax=Elusimicrobium simillimum TaxID=3143438 RepID=UPI003C6EC08C